MGCGTSHPVQADGLPPAKKPPAAQRSQPFDDSENGHKPIESKLDASKSKWAALNAKCSVPAANTGMPLAMVADQDEASADAEGYTSYLAFGKLVYNGQKGEGSYSIDLPGEQPIRTKRGDKAGRGAEYSALEIFAARMITADDRTGNLDEIVQCGDGQSGLLLTCSQQCSLTFPPSTLR